MATSRYNPFRKIASLNRETADKYGAVAAWWRHVHEAGFQCSPEHEARDGQCFVLRNTWATQKRLVKSGSSPYLDDIDGPGETPGCRCWAEFVYDLGELPDAMLTRKGEKQL